MSTSNIKSAKSFSITLLTPVSFASLNGGDKEAANISSIKKLTRGNKDYPYVSAQALRRALRDQLGTMGHKLSEGQAATIKKGAATTLQDPVNYIDDDLFGFMEAEKGEEGEKGGANKRTSPVRVSPLLALEEYKGNLDFGTNYMSVKSGGDPNIFETEIHGGLYRGTILIELDRVGIDEALSPKWKIDSKQREIRVLALLTVIQNLWTSGRSSRFLADLSPKFVAAALTKVKIPLFLECVRNLDGGVDPKPLQETVQDHRDILLDHVFGARSGLFATVPEGTITMGEAFEKMKSWVTAYFGE